MESDIQVQEMLGDLMNKGKKLVNTLVNKAKENAAARQKYRETNPGGNITQKQYQDKIKMNPNSYMNK